MATSSQYVAAKTALVELLNAAITANTATLAAAEITQTEAFYAWPGADSLPDCIFLGRHPDLVANPLLSSTAYRSEDPVMKAGRRQRQQEFEIEVTCWSFRGDVSPLEARKAELGGEALFGIVDGVLADNRTLGLSTLQSAELTSGSPGLVPILGGWASVFVPVITVKSRLT